MTNADWHGAWSAALDELELDLAEVETMLADDRRNTEMPPADLWRPPTALGALPLEPTPRVGQILTRQLEAAQEIARWLTSNRRQFAVTARIETGESVKRPVYVDRAM